MPSPFQQSGAQLDPSNAAPLHTNRIFTGLWTQRSPLRDAATPYLYEKFYSASRYDSLIAGQNTEITAKLTLARRPGSSVYNSNTFTDLRRFYSFRTFVDGQEAIKIIGGFLGGFAAEVTAGVPVLTLALGAPGAFIPSFISIGNTLYISNGVQRLKWTLSEQSWSAIKEFDTGSFIVDPNNNIQVATLGVARPLISEIEAVVQTNAVGVTSHLVIFTLAGATAPAFTAEPGNTVIAITPSGLTAQPAYNGVGLQVSTDSTYAAVAAAGPNQVVCTTAIASVFSSTPETGILTGFATGENFLSGAVQPNWPTAIGALTTEGNLLWVCKGSAVTNWGIDPPTIAPTTAQVTLPAIYPPWTASTSYSPNQLILDSNSNIQLLTLGGTTGAAAPTWATTPVGATTTDGTAIWTLQGSGIRTSLTHYDVGDIIAVTFTSFVTVNFPAPPHQVPVVNNLFFRCTTAGISGTSIPAWGLGFGIKVADGTVVWSGYGEQRTWANVGPSLALSLSQTIVDSNGNLEQVLNPGLSGTTPPIWQTALGAITVDGATLWTNGGPYSAAGTAPWVYAYAWKNSSAGSVSTASPLSPQLTLGPDSQVILQGPGSTDTQIDTIVLYRTVQGGSTLLWMAEIPAPPNGGAWSYTSTETDADLNFLIQAQIASSNNPPPVGLTALTYHLGRIWGFVQNTVFYAAGPDTLSGNGSEAWPPLNFFAYPSNGTRLWPTSIGLVVLTASDIALIPGQGTSTQPFYSIPFQPGLGLLSYDAFTSNGSTAYMMLPSGRVISLDPGAGEVEIGFPIGDRLKVHFDPATCYLAWHDGSSADSGLYVGNAVDRWFRMSAITAPESGFAWSPQAFPAGGVLCVQSVETVPGTSTLLYSQPNGSHPILQRDDSVFDDNGVAFEAFADIGSIVLAQGGEIAALYFVTAETTLEGSRPNVSVLLGEIFGDFEPLPFFRHDPPNLPPAKTLYGGRYYLMQSQNAVWCKHLQIRIGWPAESANNELLTYTIYGSIHEDS